ncbi:hypothetical protein L6232_23140, partial [Shewanella sp. C31]|nr:hypothetical protein [Shewanella electrica]
MARHLQQAGQGREAASVLRVLAQEAWRAGHPEEAIPLYQEALEAAPEGWHPALAQELQDAEASLGLKPEAASGPRSQDPARKALRET